MPTSSLEVNTLKRVDRLLKDAVGSAGVTRCDEDLSQPVDVRDAFVRCKTRSHDAIAEAVDVRHRKAGDQQGDI